MKSVELMHNLCSKTALLTGHLASHYLSQNGLLVFTGSAAVFDKPQPEMIGYALAKTATHAIALNMKEVLPKESKVVTILPNTLDTPGN